jgi:hypothetical protein
MPWTILVLIALAILIWRLVARRRRRRSGGTPPRGMRPPPGGGTLPPDSKPRRALGPAPERPPVTVPNGGANVPDRISWGRDGGTATPS